MTAIAKSPIISAISAAIVVAIVSLISINSFVYPRTEGEKLEAIVKENKKEENSNYRDLGKQIGELKTLMIKLHSN